jgi:uncharacterized protein YccT (UPF0319 family)
MNKLTYLLACLLMLCFAFSVHAQVTATANLEGQ